MIKKYLILNKKVLFSPLSLIDNKKNSKIIELSIEEVKKYVEELNQKYGEDLFFYMEREEWLKQLETSQINEFLEKMDNECQKIMDSPEIKEIREKIYRETDKNINGFMIPFEADNNEDYEKKLKDKLAAFIKEIDRPAFRKEGSLVNDVRDICKNVICTIKAAKKGNTEKAEEILTKILKNYINNPFAVSELDKSYAFRGLAPFVDLRQNSAAEEDYEKMMEGELNFFRARVVNKAETIQKKEEINYLPYSKRDKAKDMRFSSSENVCLYLGTTSYVCSKECRWNGTDNLYLSSFKFNEKGKKLKILNLVILQSLLNGMIPRPGNNFNTRELHNAMIRVFPLAIATMFTIHTSDEERKKKCGETIKVEYLLSQILMNVLHKADIDIDGVAYLSRQGKDDFQYPQMVCLAIPITDTSEKDEYGELINDFVMTNPKIFNESETYSTYKTKSYINEKYPKYLKYSWGETENVNAQVDYNGNTVFYQDTPYSKMDDYLVNQTHEKFMLS